MSRILILMRHAKSSWDDPDLADHDRPLNQRGYVSAEAMGHWMRIRGHMPDAAIISSSTRTVETFERLGFDVACTQTRTLYHSGPEVMMDVLRDQHAHCVLMLGHNPGIADFSDRLVSHPPRHPGFADFPTGAAAVIAFDVDIWNEIGWRSGQPMDFAIPRDVML